MYWNLFLTAYGYKLGKKAIKSGKMGAYYPLSGNGVQVESGVLLREIKIE